MKTEALRWEKFAPGPVRKVVVAAAKPKPAPTPPGEPKRRGRKRKNPPQDQEQDQEQQDVQIFEGKSDAGVAMPALPGKEEDVVFAIADPQQPAAVPIPTRSTFAGRPRTGSAQHQLDWDARRAKYYQCVPPSFWKDGFERTFWSMCTANTDMEVAMKKFLEEIGFEQVSAVSLQIPPARARCFGLPTKQLQSPSQSPWAVVEPVGGAVVVMLRKL